MPQYQKMHLTSAKPACYGPGFLYCWHSICDLVLGGHSLRAGEAIHIRDAEFVHRSFYLWSVRLWGYCGFVNSPRRVVAYIRRRLIRTTNINNILLLSSVHKATIALVFISQYRLLIIYPLLPQVVRIDWMSRSKNSLGIVVSWSLSFVLA